MMEFWKHLALSVNRGNDQDQQHGNGSPCANISRISSMSLRDYENKNATLGKKH